MSRTPSFRAHANKENLFIQIANKKSQSSTSQKKKNLETFKFADEHYDELIEKINCLDKENNKLRELLKKSSYLQFQFVDLSHSRVDPDFHSLSEIKNRSLDLSFDDNRQILTPRGQQMNSDKRGFKNSSLAAKQVHYQRHKKGLVESCTQEMISQENADYQIPEEQDKLQFGSEIYKELLLQIVQKDGKIFKILDSVIQQELNQNYKQNFDNYTTQSNFMMGLMKMLDRILEYYEGNHPDNIFIMRSYKQFKNILQFQQRLFEKMKLFIIPLNSIQNTLQERVQEIEKLQLLIEQANTQLSQATDVITQLVDENSVLKKQNGIFQNCFTQISQCVMQNEHPKNILDLIINETVQELIPLVNYDIQHTIQPQEPTLQIKNNLTQQIIQLQEKYSKIIEKNNKNKLKFKKYLNYIYNQFESKRQIEGFDFMTIEEQIQVICKTITQK